MNNQGDLYDLLLFNGKMTPWMFLRFFHLTLAHELPPLPFPPSPIPPLNNLNIDNLSKQFESLPILIPLRHHPLLRGSLPPGHALPIPRVNSLVEFTLIPLCYNPEGRETLIVKEGVVVKVKETLRRTAVRSRRRER